MKYEEDEIQDAIDSLLKDGIIVCIGYNELGEELYASKEYALKNNIKIFSVLEKGNKNDQTH